MPLIVNPSNIKLSGKIKKQITPKSRKKYDKQNKQGGMLGSVVRLYTWTCALLFFAYIYVQRGQLSRMLKDSYVWGDSFLLKVVLAVRIDFDKYALLKHDSPQYLIEREFE